MSLEYEPFSEPLHISAKLLWGGGPSPRGSSVAGEKRMVRVARLRQFQLTSVWNVREKNVSWYSTWVVVEGYSHGARPVHLIITMIKWIRTSRLSFQLTSVWNVREKNVSWYSTWVVV